MKTLKVSVAALWRSNYMRPEAVTMGSLHLKTVKIIMESPDTPLSELPLYSHMLSDEYVEHRKRRGRIIKKESIKRYLTKYKNLYESIKRDGFKTPPYIVAKKEDEVLIVIDGNRRLNILMAIGALDRVIDVKIKK